MQFNWINAFGAIIMALIMVPNIIYAARFKGEENKCTSKALSITEQVGRYGCFALMVVNLGVYEFGFRSTEGFCVWLVLNILLLLSYFVFWAFYFKKQTRFAALMLAVIPCLIFFTNGIILRHWLLVIFAFIFTVGHISVTLQNAPKD